MYCPKCGQQQNVEDNRFCSRCGFKLRVVKALVDGDDPDSASLVTVIDPAFRRRYLTFGSLWMFILAFFCCWLAIAAPWGSLVPIFLLIFSWLLLMVFIYIKPLAAFFFRGPKIGTSSVEAERVLTESNYIKPSQEPKVLAPGYSSPNAQYFSPTPVTGEMQRPFSVTEDTTNLLKRESDF